ncbi:MAG: DUF2892 domain-containing protein [Clostridia bacterium]|nr:DUF2892 domain-containing protein [Clostridia bacterium]
MHIQKNVGILDSYIRIASGLMMLGYGISKSSSIMTGFGAIKVAEGVTKFCPMLYVLGLSTVDIEMPLKSKTNTMPKENLS